MTDAAPLPIDVVSDVVCPWCYIGKHRIESALALVPDVPVKLNFRPFFLNPWVPREGISREDYLTKKFGSVEAYKGIAGRVVAAASEEGLVYRPERVARQPNTTDCHRLILWAEANFAKEAGIDGVPCFVFGRLMAVSGAQPPDALAQTIERAAQEVAKRVAAE